MDQQNNNQYPGAQPPPPKKQRRQFENLMRRGEKIAGWIYLPIHIIALPLLLPTLLYLFNGGVSETDTLTMNVWYYLIGVVVLLVTQFRFFRDSFNVMTHNFRDALITMLIGYGILMAANIALNLIISVFGSLPTSPNQDAVEALTEIDNRRMAAVGVIMAPIVEEMLFRGMIFGSIRKKSMVAAYLVSVVLFAVYHVWQYVVVSGSFELLLSAIAYVPIGFVLAFCYDRSGSIWTSIFFHMFYNALALTLS